MKASISDYLTELNINKIINQNLIEELNKQKYMNMFNLFLIKIGEEFFLHDSFFFMRK